MRTMKMDSGEPAPAIAVMTSRTTVTGNGCSSSRRRGESNPMLLDHTTSTVADIQISTGLPSNCNSNNTKNEIIHQFNSTNAKLVAFVVICGFVLYHTVLRLTHGLDSCKWLLTDGNFRDQVWQPYGCMMHHYTHLVNYQQESFDDKVNKPILRHLLGTVIRCLSSIPHLMIPDARRCLRYMEYWGIKNHFVFIGDSRIEQLYHGFIHQISPGYQGNEKIPVHHMASPVSNPSKQNSAVENGFLFSYDQLSRRDLSYNDSQLGLRIQFLWYPYTNKSMITALQHFREGKDTPSVVVIGSGGYSIKMSNPLDPNVLEDYTASLTHLMLNPGDTKNDQLYFNFSSPGGCSYVTISSRNNNVTAFFNKFSTIISFCLQHIDSLAEGKTKVLWALQEPVDTEKLDESWTPVTNERIDLYNRQSQKILRYSKASIWSSGRLVAMENIEETTDGYHLGSKTLFQDSQILLNMYCNDNMNYNDATCCSSSETISKLQIVTFSILFVSFVLACFLFIRQKCKNKTDQKLGFTPLRNCHVVEKETIVGGMENSYDLIMALAKIALILTFFFICDRTTMFMKENKYFTQTNFWLPVIYILVLGIFFTEDSSYTKVLHKDQDLELKGWMVLTILIYNMMGASQVLPIYLFVKIIYSSLLFLQGWSQFLNYMQRGDYSFVRCFQDLFRLNAMAVLLCVCMNRPYQFYEFVPLISFWTVVLYIALSVPPRITWGICEANSLNYLHLVFKIIGILTFVTILYMSEVFFEKVFVTRPWKALFVTTDDDIHDWWTRWKVDRYSMTAGVVAAFGTHVLRRYKILKDDNHGNLFSMRLCIVGILFAVSGIGAYATFSVLCRNQPECLEIHSYVVFIPILGYIILRNLSGILRTRFSAFFAWFGQFWIELLVGKYHVFMGADGHGVLVLVPAYPVGNVLLIAFVFACTAHEFHCCTETLLNFAVPEDWKKTLRNVIVFFVILIPIGVSNGMF